MHVGSRSSSLQVVPQKTPVHPRSSSGARRKPIRSGKAEKINNGLAYILPRLTNATAARTFLIYGGSNIMHVQYYDANTVTSKASDMV